MDDDLRILARQLFDNPGQQPGHERLRTSDVDQPRGRVRKEFDVTRALLELIEYRGGAPKQGLRIEGRCDTTWIAVEETHAKNVIEIGDRARYSWLRHRKLLRRLPHAAAFHDGRKNMEVANSQPTSEAA